MSNRVPPPASGLLYSGGLDSSMLLVDMLAQGQRVYPIYIQAGLIWEAAELAAARRFLESAASSGLAELVVLDLPLGDLYSGHWSITGSATPGAESGDEEVFLLGRNPLLMIKARLWCQTHGIGQLAIGCLGGSPFADASLDFLAEFERVMDRAALGHVRLVRPLEYKAPALRAARRRSARSHLLMPEPASGVALRSVQQMRGAAPSVCRRRPRRPDQLRRRGNELGQQGAS